MTLFTTMAVVASLLLAGPTESLTEKERAALEAGIRALNKEQIRKIVVALETDPLSDDAEQMRAGLLVYFEPIDYDVCLDQIGFLMDAKPETLKSVFWQVVFSSGDFFLHNPGADRLTYMQAGLEAGLRVYERILTAKADARNEKLDELLRLRNDGHLAEYVKANPCNKK